tara:strand:+ start:120 stop:1328 length:1209 start_codon:yes stop_codon:yes gene_type:complete
VKKYIPRSIQNIFDRVEAFNESITEKLFSDKLPSTFEVIVYASKNPEVKNATTQNSTTDDGSNINSYYYYNARSLVGHHDHLTTPESATTIDQYDRFRSAHFQAIIKKNKIKTHLQTGEIWLASETGANIVTLLSYQRTKSIRFHLSDKSDAAKSAHSNGSETVGTNGDYLTSEISAGEADRKQYNSSTVSANSPIPPVNATQKKLLDFISKREGSYNASNNGTDRQKKIRNSIPGTSYVAENFVTSTKKRSDQKLLSTMTLKEIIALQKGRNPYLSPNAGHKRTLFAVGAYQIIPETMFSAILSSGLSDTAIFNEETQDKLGLALIYGGKRPKLRDYLRGSNSVTLAQAQTDFALEWASVPLPSGKSAYSGTGNEAGHTSAEVQAVLKQVRALNIQNGFTV